MKRVRLTESAKNAYAGAIVLAAFGTFGYMAAGAYLDPAPVPSFSTTPTPVSAPISAPDVSVSAQTPIPTTTYEDGSWVRGDEHGCTPGAPCDTEPLPVCEDEYASTGCVYTQGDRSWVVFDDDTTTELSAKQWGYRLSDGTITIS